MYAGTFLYFVLACIPVMQVSTQVCTLKKWTEKKIFKTFFKYNDNGEQKFCNFNQLTPVGKRIQIRN